MKRNVIELLFKAAKTAVFDNPDVDLSTNLVERREDQSPILPYGADELALRDIMFALGVGRQNNLTPSRVGLTEGYIAIVEGGQGHKMLAELQLILEGPMPSKIIFMAGSRVIVDAEKLITAKVLGIEVSEVGSTELEVAKQVAARVSNIEVELLQLTAGESNATRLRAIAYNNPNKQIGFATSCTYLPSRRIDAEKSETGAVAFGYGSELLATVKDETLPDEPALSQIVSELYALNKTLSMS